MHNPLVKRYSIQSIYVLVKCKHLLYIPSLMVPSYHQYCVRPLQLRRQQICHELRAVRPSVYVVSEEEDPGRRESCSRWPECCFHGQECGKIAVEIPW